MKLKKGDKVIILCGKDGGKKGKILKVYPKDGKIMVEGINIVKKHARPTQNFQGGIVDRPAAIAASKVMLVCPRCGKPAKLGHKIVDEKKVRFCRKCKETVDKV